jgi:hypothetical protein
MPRTRQRYPTLLTPFLFSVYRWCYFLHLLRLALFRCSEFKNKGSHTGGLLRSGD